MRLLKLSYLQYLSYTLVIIIAAGYLMNIGQFILAPLLFATFLSVALIPILNQFQKLIKSEIASVSLLMLCCALVLGGIGIIIVDQLSEIISQYEGLTQKFIQSSKEIKQFIQEKLDVDISSVQQLILDNSKEIINSGSKTALSFANSLSSFLFYLFLIPFYTFFMLLYRKSIAKLIEKLMKRIHVKFASLVNDFSELIQNYFKGMLLLMLIMGGMNSLGLFILNVPYPLALGFILALFSIIPYVGVIIGGVFIMFISYATQGSLSTLGFIVILIAITQFIEGNFLTPAILGDRLNVNTLVAILGMFIGGKIWGIAGLLIAIPTIGVFGILIDQWEDEAFYVKEDDDNDNH